jgi:NADPH:quinone reductase-like Zn-dependent oxidoreductase
MYEPSNPVDVEHFRIEPDRTGRIDSVVFRPLSFVEPGEGEVAVRIKAAAISTSDVQKVLGEYSVQANGGGAFALSLGIECSGTVMAIGGGVEGFQIGQEVLGIVPGALASYAVTNSAFLIPKPSHLAFEAAATLPLAMLTAYYALHRLAGIARDDRILIHGATADVGLAAIQVAQRAGATILASATSPVEQDFLRALGVHLVTAPESPNLVEEVRAFTKGEGVDIVLNFLSGEVRERAFGLVASCGRFIELTDHCLEMDLGARNTKSNFSFFNVDIPQLLSKKPVLAAGILQEIQRDISRGEIHPLPYRALACSSVVEAFQVAAARDQPGKIVVSMDSSHSADISSPPQSIAFRADSTYLLTGGLGGVGLRVAHWMVTCGARNIVLVGRTGASSHAKQEAVEALRQMGARTVVVEADVSNASQLANALEKIESELPPLRGVIHGAMVLDDDFVVRLNPERFSRVTCPKVNGAWNLHLLTLKSPLDFFVLFSSASSIFGNTGQGSYGAANAFLDALAHYRRARNLPAMSINWGGIEGVGVVSRDEGIAKLLSSRGIELLTAERTIALLERFMRSNPVQIGGVRINARKLRGFLPLVPRFEAAVQFDKEVAAIENGNEHEDAPFRRVILNVPPGERVSHLVEHIKDVVADVFRIDRSQVDPQKALSKSGMDSLMATDVKSRVAKNLKVDLSILYLLQDVNIIQIATKLSSDLQAAEEKSANAEVDEILIALVGLPAQERQALISEHRLQAS